MPLLFNSTYEGHAGTLPGAGTSFNINNDAFVDITFSNATDPGNLFLDADVSELTVTILGVVTNSAFTVFERGSFQNDANNDGILYEYVIIDVQGTYYLFLHDNGATTAGIAGFAPTDDFVGGNQNPLDPTPYCFVNGTAILTESGEINVECLQVGDAVVTKDCGPKHISWIGKRQMNTNLPSHHVPVRITAGALGNGLPKRDLLVSPQHRVLLTDWRAELMFGTSEVLVAAKHLINDTDIRVATDLAEFEYYHVMFDTHQTIFSEGLPTESFHPGDMAMKSLSDDARAELLEIFPELENNISSYGKPTHVALKSFEAKALSAA